LGLDVPGQLSVTGFGDWEVSRLISPALTTIHSDAVRIGSLTARNLLSQIEPGNDDNVQQIEFEPELIVRSSTAPPRE
jgi:LacI family transcriptional regulator